MATGIRTDFRPNLDVFGAWRRDPGWLYIIKVSSYFKIGVTTNPKRRLLAARTWLPRFELVGMKPFWNAHILEKELLVAFAQFWVAGEWHQFPDASYDFVFEGFDAFYDEDRDMNSVDFTYWMHEFGEALSEFCYRDISLRKWQRESGAR